MTTRESPLPLLLDRQALGDTLWQHLTKDNHKHNNSTKSTVPERPSSWTPGLGQLRKKSSHSTTFTHSANAPATCQALF